MSGRCARCNSFWRAALASSSSVRNVDHPHPVSPLPEGEDRNCSGRGTGPHGPATVARRGRRTIDTLGVTLEQPTPGTLRPAAAGRLTMKARRRKGDHGMNVESSRPCNSPDDRLGSRPPTHARRSADRIGSRNHWEMTGESWRGCPDRGRTERISDDAVVDFGTSMVNSLNHRNCGWVREKEDLPGRAARGRTSVDIGTDPVAIAEGFARNGLVTADDALATGHENSTDDNCRTYSEHSALDAVPV